MSLWSLLEDAFYHYVDTDNIDKIKTFVGFFPFVTSNHDVFNYVTKHNNLETILIFLEKNLRG